MRKIISTKSYSMEKFSYMHISTHSNTNPQKYFTLWPSLSLHMCIASALHFHLVLVLRIPATHPHVISCNCVLISVGIFVLLFPLSVSQYDNVVSDKAFDFTYNIVKTKYIENSYWNRKIVPHKLLSVLNGDNICELWNMHR